MKNKNSPQKLNAKQKVAVGFGAVPYSQGGQIISTMAPSIYQIHLSMNPLLFGIAMMLPRLWGAFVDPIIGVFSDRLQTRWGRRKPLIFVGLVFMALTFNLVWWVPSDATQLVLFLWLLIGNILFFTAYSLFAVPMTSLTYELTPDYDERIRLMFFWALFVNLGSLSVHWFGPMTNHSIFGGNPLLGARWLALIAGLFLFIGLGMVPLFLVKERAKSILGSGHSEGFNFSSLKKQIGSNKALMSCLGVILPINVMGVFMGVIAQYIVIHYMFLGDLGEGMKLNAMNGTLFGIIGFITLPIILKIALRIGKEKMLKTLLVIASFGGLIKWFTFNSEMPYLIFFDAILCGPLWAGLAVLLPAMIADVCDQDEWISCERREGLIGSVFGIIPEIAMALSYLLTGLVLMLSGIDREVHSADSSQGGSILILRVSFVSMAFILPLISIYFLNKYPLSKKKVEQLRMDLEARRGA
tara:strand:+ start:255 stop:1661 length:1407 start_codon:yes stop_codon:yes gene_type:complete